MEKRPVTKVYIGSDHAGFSLKNFLLTHRNFIDLGVQGDTPSNYAPLAHKVAHAVLEDPGSFGVLLCGTGIGVSIAANRHIGIRAALCHNVPTVESARRHNDANILALGARVISPEDALRYVDIFLKTPFDGGRHEARIHAIEEDQ